MIRRLPSGKGPPTRKESESMRGGHSAQTVRMWLKQFPRRGGTRQTSPLRFVLFAVAAAGISQAFVLPVGRFPALKLSPTSATLLRGGALCSGKEARSATRGGFALRMEGRRLGTIVPIVPSEAGYCTSGKFDIGPSSVPSGLLLAGAFQNYTQRALLLPEAFSAKEAVDFMRTYTVQSDEELAEADESTRAMDSSSLEVLYVKRANGTLVGYVTAADILILSGKTRQNFKLGDMARPFTVILHVDDDPEDMLRKFRNAGFALRAPLIDREGRIVGVINPQDVLRQQQIEDTDDMLRFSGVINPLRDTEESLGYATYFGTPVWTHIKQRSVVLTVLLLLQSLSSVVLSRYQGLLERNVFLALFLTMLTGTGGNAGNQSSALVIRGLSTGEINRQNSGKVVIREVLASSIIALMLSAAAFSRVMLTRGASIQIGIVIAFATYATVVFAVAGGTIVPLTLQRLGLDPCNLSSPMLATLTDILGVLLLCVVSSVILEGSYIAGRL